MEHLVKKYIASLVRAGMTGSRSNFALAVGNFISRIKHSDQEFARELAGMVSKESILRAEALPLIPADADAAMELLDVIYPAVAETEPLLDDASKAALERVLKEWRNLDVLSKQGLSPARLLLLHGPSGTGKTLVAQWLAEQLNLPLMTLNLASLIGNYSDKSKKPDNNLRTMFAHAARRPCVLVLDEFEAIAKQPNNAGANEEHAGKLSRQRTTLLQALDEWAADSLLIASSKQGDSLDAAVLRRFDHALAFELPGSALIEICLTEIDMTPDARRNLAALLQGESFSTIRQLILRSRKMALLDRLDFVPTLIRNAIRLRIGNGNERDNALKTDEGEMLLMYMDGISLRDIGLKFQKSHPTVSRIVKRYLGAAEDS